MRVVFAGTPPFAARALAAIHGAGHHIALVLTQPNRPAGRGLKLTSSAVATWAGERQLPVAKPASLKQADAVAQRIAAQAAGAVEIEADPFRPVLRARLLTGGEPCYLQAELTGGQGEASLAAAEALWSIPGKIAAAELGHYLARTLP